MKRLTESEIQFIRDTGYTATVWQNDEWHRTCWGTEPSYSDIVEYCTQNGIAEVYDEPSAVLFLQQLQEKFNSDEDAISLEMLAIYLFRTFLSPAKLEETLAAPSEHGVRPSALWLQDWKYNFGFRKWEDADYLVRDALNPAIKLDTSSDEIWYDEYDETTD